MDCKERYYDLIGVITAYPISSSSFYQPFMLMRKDIHSGEFSMDESSKIIVPMKKQTGVLKETPALSTAGESYEIKITWQIDEVTKEVYNALYKLKDNVCHIKITSFGDNDMIVRSLEYGYQMSFYESNGELFCELTVHNVNGAQRVI